MWTLVLRGVAARRRRFVLAMLAVVVGVGFVSGTLTLSQGVRAAYSRLLSQVTAGIDVYVRGPETDRLQGISDFAPVPNALLRRVARLPDVAAAQGEVVRIAAVVNAHGRFLGTDHPTYGYSWPADPQHSPFELIAGRAPLRAEEVVLDAQSARQFDMQVGSRLSISFDVATPAPALLVGLVAPRIGGDLAGATAVFVSAPWAQHLAGIGDHWDLLELTARHGVSPDQLRNAVAAAIPHDGTTAITSREYADAEVQNLAQRSESITSLLLALSVLAALVAVAVILNTHRVVLAQRTHELAMLRLIGASRGQLYAIVAGEAAVVGLVASAIGAVLGIPVSFILQAAVQAFTGQALPNGLLSFDAVTLITTAVGGAIVATLIALLPARRATAVSPLTAVRRAAVVPAQPRKRRAEGLAIASVAILGIAALAGGLSTSAAYSLGAVIGGALALSVALIVAIPLAARPAVRSFTPLAKAAGVSGRIARSNMLRDPGRTAAPAAALAVGLGMATCVSVLASSTDQSVSSLVQRVDRANLVVVSDAAPGIDPEAVSKLREAPDVAVVSEMGSEAFTVDGRSDFVTALEPETFRSVLAFTVDSGSEANFGSVQTVMVTQSEAQAHGYRVGDVVSAQFQEPQVYPLRIVAIIGDNGVTRSWIIPWDTFGRGYPTTAIRAAFIRARAGVSQHDLETEVRFGVNGFPGIVVDDASAYARAQAQAVEGPVSLIEALIALSIIVAVIGVMDAMGLAVVERTPELGLLRLVGMTPLQLSLTVYVEAALTMLLGVVAGVLTGALTAALIVQGLRVHGIDTVVIPWPAVLAVAAAVVLGGLLGASLPARRASHVPMPLRGAAEEA